MTTSRPRLVAMWALLGLAALLPSAVQAAEPGSMLVYFGTYGRGDDQGIFVAEFDPATGKLSPARLAAEAVNASFLAVHPRQRRLYAVGEVDDLDGQKTGGVSGYEIDPASGRLTRINQQSSGGGGPCHLTVDATGRHVLVANYGGGSVASLPIDTAGRLGPITSFHQHHGSSVNPQRQEGPHAHSINLDAAGRLAIAADLGLDQLLVYRFDAGSGKLTPGDPPFGKAPAGGGPRHVAFHPQGRWVYANNELTSSVTLYRFNPENGALEALQTVSTLPADFQGENTTAEVRVHPSGRFVYVSNRGHDSLAIFAVDASTGHLTPRGHASSGGRVPRNFNLDPSGRHLLAANQDSANVIVLAVDQQSGGLTPTGQSIAVPMPVCLRFFDRAR